MEKTLMSKKMKSNSTVAPKPGVGLNSSLVLGFLFFFIPILSAFLFSVQVGDGTYTLSVYDRIIKDPGLADSLWLSFKLVFMTLAIVLFLMVPTVTWLHIRAQRAKRTVEFITLLPLIIPPVVTALGLLSSMPGFLIDSPYLLGFAYGALTMPYTYRSLDAGLNAVDVKTLVDASRGLGASWRQVLVSVIAPNIKAGIFGAIFLAVALVLGEFVLASLLIWNTLPVWMALVGMSDAEGAVAISVLSLFFVWLLLLVLSLLDGSRKAQVQKQEA
jgi:putative spermidine/putrescine transport system permease protein